MPGLLQLQRAYHHGSLVVSRSLRHVRQFPPSSTRLISAQPRLERHRSYLRESQLLCLSRGASLDLKKTEIRFA